MAKSHQPFSHRSFLFVLLELNISWSSGTSFSQTYGSNSIWFGKKSKISCKPEFGCTLKPIKGAEKKCSLLPDTCDKILPKDGEDFLPEPQVHMSCLDREEVLGLENGAGIFWNTARPLAEACQIWGVSNDTFSIFTTVSKLTSSNYHCFCTLWLYHLLSPSHYSSLKSNSRLLYHSCHLLKNSVLFTKRTNLIGIFRTM